MNLEKILIIILLITIITILIIKKTIRDKEKIKYTIKNLNSIFIILTIVFLTRSFIIEPFKIPSGSMKPNLIEGDFIFVNKFIYGIKIPIINKEIIRIKKPQRGDVIVFIHKDGSFFIKRLIGLPGDHIKYENKNIFINNKMIDHKFKDISIYDINIECFEEKIENKKYNIYIDSNLKKNNYPYKEITIPEKKYFVLGDNRDISDDSRYWGLLEEKQIIGKAFIIWFSIDTNSKEIRFNRLLKIIK